MKAFKRRIAFILAACMVLTSAIPAYASESQQMDEVLSEASEVVVMENEELADPEAEETIVVEDAELADSEAEESIAVEDDVTEPFEEVEEFENDAENDEIASPSDTATASESEEELLLGSEGVATASVSYIDENGVEQTHECILITSQDNYTFKDGGWYAVEGSVSIANRIINEALAKTPAHLILTDGCKLNAPKGLSNVVYYAGSGKKVRGLYIYGQENSTGKLIVTSPERWHAGIGGQGGQPASTLVINGGTIISYGGEEGAGIGNGHSNTNNENITITINGGKIIAVGGKRAAGIGAGHSGYSPNVTINGGIVRARGGIGGAAIGTGYQTKGGNVYINGGDVLADRAREKLWPKDAYPYAIGPGEDAAGSGKTYVKDGLTSSYLEYYNGDPYIKPGFFPNNNQVHIKTLKYRVEHYLQNADGTYNNEPDVSEEFVGQKGNTTEAAADYYEGFTAQTFDQKTIDDPTPDTPEMINAEHKSTNQDFGSIMPDPGSPSTVVTIYYARKQYTINYDINKPENAPDEVADKFVAPASVSAAYGATVSEPVRTIEPAKTQYQFGGWYREKECKNPVTFPVEMPLGGTTFYAKWIPAQYNITWKVDTQPGYITVADYGSYPVYGKKIPELADHIFTGWKDSHGMIGIHVATESETYTAQFALDDGKLHLITFDTQGGNYINPATVSNGSKIAQYPEAKKSGFVFAGWYADTNYVTLWDTNHEFTSEDAKIITLHAKWDYQNPIYWYLKQSGELVITDVADPALQSSSAYHGVFDASKRFAACDDTWEPYKKLIKTVSTIKNRNIKPLYCDNWFKGCDNVTTIQISSIDTSETVSMAYMFSGCAWLDYLGLSLDTKNVTDMSYMFEGCTELLTVGFGSNWNTTNVINMAGMFKDCSKLSRLDLRSFSFANVTDLSESFYMCTALNEIVWPTTINVYNVEYFWRTFAFCIELEDIPMLTAPNTVETEEMFRYCKKLKEVDISGLKDASLKNIQRMFEGCGNLRTIYAAEGMDLSSVSIKKNSNMFNGCTSLVGGNGQKYDEHIVNNEYARVDTEANCGYFTLEGKPPVLYVTFEANNRTNPVIVQVISGQTVIAPANPVYDHNTFLGWFCNPELTIPYDFGTAVTQDITLYGKWEIVPNRTGGGGSSGGGSSAKEIVAQTTAFTGTYGLPVTGGIWSKDSLGNWSYTTVQKFANTWAYIFNPYATGNQPAASWFYFDPQGNMLTGWQWIKGADGISRCYYFNPFPNGMLGACQLGGVTPDGFTLDATGAWTVNGVVQTR